MADEPKGPTRAWTLKLEIGADSEKDLLFALKQIRTDFLLHGVPVGNGASGGCDSGWSYAVKHDPEMTPEKYQEQLAAYVDMLNEREATETRGG